jgi:hypothetical protein
MRLALLLVIAIGCAEEPAREDPAAPSDEHPAAPIEASDTREEPSRPDFLPRLDGEADWARVAYRDPNLTLAHTEVVKVVVEVNGERVWFCASERWPLHYDFARRFLARDFAIGDRGAFNTRQYRRDDRTLILASIVRHLDGDVWTVELGPADSLPGERIAALLERLGGATWLGDRLRFHPRSHDQRERVRGIEERVRVIEVDELRRGVRYQPLTPGVAFGTLRIVRGALDRGAIAPSDVIVTREVPEDLPLCAGLVTSELQTPLAHVAVLSRNRGTPNMALRGAVDDPEITALEGQLVRLSVEPQRYTLERASREDAEVAWASRRPPNVTVPALDATATGLIELCDVGHSDRARVGVKAAELGEVCSLRPRIATPGGFVVPFHFYLAHLRAHGIDPSSLGELDRPALHARLAEMRRRIVEAPLDPAVAELVAARLRVYRGRRLIFRSSTNAEDLLSFNGAGLYDSIVVDRAPDAERIAGALRGVWASVWTERAYEEREWARIDHARVAMAVLVQPFVDDAAAIGVAITANPYTEDRPGFQINVQPAGGSVTSPETDVPEEVMIYRGSVPEVLSRSSRTNGEAVLGAADLRALRDVLARLHEHFMPLWPGANACDVELIVTRARTVVVLQARPYRVTYAEAQRRRAR